MRPLVQINDEVREMNDDEFAGYEYAQSQIPVKMAEEVRAARNQKLKECDWTQLADVTLSQEQMTAWAEYRQALRDITAQDGFPMEIVWPTQP